MTERETAERLAEFVVLWSHEPVRLFAISCSSPPEIHPGGGPWYGLATTEQKASAKAASEGMTIGPDGKPRCPECSK